MHLLSIEGLMLVGLACGVFGFIVGKIAEKRNYCFHITPTKKKKSKYALGIGTKVYEVGYQAQLHVRGFSCLKPHEVIVESNHEINCDVEEVSKTIKDLVEAALPQNIKGIRYLIK
jgi:hypothetical protein